MNCLNCKGELLTKDSKKFCSKSCAGTYNGKVFPKRSKEKINWPKCFCCDNKVARKSGKFCKECISNKKHYHGTPIESQTIIEGIRREGANRYDMIRYHARRIFKKELNNPLCEKCGYDKHVEICHRKAISEFPKDTLIIEVNNRNNVLFLCPNCHWEFDNK
jgi:hypothetical protein